MSDARYWLIVGLAFASVGATWYGLGYVPAEIARSTRPDHDKALQHVGTYGDSFGRVNSLFSALAVAGVVAALCLQHREQGLAREAAKVARDEAERARAHEAELAMLAALITGRAATLQAFSYRDVRMRELTMTQDLSHAARENLLEAAESSTSGMLIELEKLIDLLGLASRKIRLDELLAAREELRG